MEAKIEGGLDSHEQEHRYWVQRGKDDARRGKHTAFQITRSGVRYDGPGDLPDEWDESHLRAVALAYTEGYDAHEGNINEH